MILHHFDPLTGELIKTLKFREPWTQERVTPSSTRKVRHASLNSDSLRYS